MRARSHIVFVSALATLGPGIARADDRATAQQLFLEGKALLKAGNVAAACPKFEGASQLSPTPGVRLNLADCWASLGRTASAWAKYNEAVAVAERNGDPAAAEDGKQARALLVPLLSYVTVVVPPPVVAESVEVTRDGEPVPPAAWNTSVPIDPGAHTFVVKARGKKSWTSRLEVAPRGDKKALTVPILEDDPAWIASAASPDAELPARRGATLRTLGWTTAGAGVVGLGIGVGFGVNALLKKSSYQSHVGSNGACLDEACQTLSHDAYLSASVANVAFVAGGALLTTGVTLWLVAPARSTRRAPVRMTAIARPGGGELRVAGEWQ